ncbi:MAG TPA: class I SAM-dependent methyltransferase [Longimicrobium sp.]|jgi:SAM-dependent methyltransferase
MRLSELYAASDSDPGPVVEFLRGLAESYGLPRPLQVLDAGCGPGRLLGPLERLRWRVTGMEPNADFFAAARSFAGSSRRVEVVRGGFLDIGWSEEFDLVVAVNSSFAHLVTPAERAEALRRIHDALRPGGVVFLDLPNFVWILSHYRQPEPYAFTAQGESVTLLRRHEIDIHDATFITTDDYVFEDGRAGDQLVHTYGIVTLPELRFHLEEAGFEDLRTFDGYAEPLSSPRILIAARRTAASHRGTEKLLT